MSLMMVGYLYLERVQNMHSCGMLRQGRKRPLSRAHARVHLSSWGVGPDPQGRVMPPSAPFFPGALFLGGLFRGFPPPLVLGLPFFFGRSNLGLFLSAVVQLVTYLERRWVTITHIVQVVQVVLREFGDQVHSSRETTED